MTTSVKGSLDGQLGKKPARKQQEFDKDLTGQYRNNFGTNNGSNQLSSLDYLQSGNYDTLDSAYSTGGSSYNTVDSSYTKLPYKPGYNSVDQKWKESSAHHDCDNGSEDHSAGLEQASLHSYELKPERNEYQEGPGTFEQLKFADDPEDSDTATETETDTELTISGCSVDMSYIPDYVRPVVAPVSVVALTSTTASYTTSRPVVTSTMTSPSMSLTSSTMTSPAGSVKDEIISPRASTYKRAERNKSPYAGYREDYVRKQKEKLCGRKSLDERLKSLESGAAVKLQVCKGSQNRRRRSGERDAAPAMRPWEKQQLNSSSRSNSLSPDKILEQLDNGDAKEIQIEPALTNAPPPDIIEAHKPPNSFPQDKVGDGNDSLTTSFEDIEKTIVEVQEEPTECEKMFHRESVTEDSTSNHENQVPDKKPHHVAIKWRVASPATSRKSSRDLDNCMDAGSLEQCKEVDDQNVSSKDYVVDMVDLPSSPKSHPSSRKLPWKEPSIETLNNSQELSEISFSANTSHEAANLAKLQDDKNTNDVAPNVTKREAPLQRRGAPAPLMLDVTTDNNAVIPVELRSPRGEGGGFGRVNMREKRSARMFILPSSDDSETDNLLARINKPVENRPVHIAPVKFVPSVLRRSRSRACKEDVISQSSSTSSIATESKAALDEGRRPFSNDANTVSTQKPFGTKEVSRRKSSRSPKRSSSKRSTRSKSTHDRPNNDRVAARTRRGSHSPTTTTSNSDINVSKSPAQKSKSSQRSKEKLTKNSSHKTEYNELTNVKRTTPRNHRKIMEGGGLSSPRQQAVAQAVKFGYNGEEGGIPYIDESGSPEEEKKYQMEEMRARASSDGALLRDTADKETCRRALPLSRRGRSSKRKDGPRRTSYMEAMESSDDLTPDPDTDGSIYSMVRTESGREKHVALSKFGRSNSADSILSTSEMPKKVVRRKHTRSSSADRNSSKGVHRRSYQIATSASKAGDALLRTPSHKRQPSIRKLKNFFGEASPQIVEAQADESRRGSRGRPLGPPPTLDLNDYDDTVVREGFLYFKVATIEKGKRTSSQKSWKLIWVVLKEQSIYLCKDWSRNKQDVSVNGGGNLPSSGVGQPPSQLPLEEEEPLNIQGSLVSIAYNYVKRRNVFKVTTCNGSEYLFQAEDRDDMLAWINSIQVSGNHDNKDGQVTINEDLILRKTSQIESGPKPEKRPTRKSRSPKPVRRVTVPVKDIDGSRRFKWRGSVNRIVRKFGQGQTLMQGGTFDVHLEDCPPSLNNEFVPFVVDLCCRVVEERGLTFMGIYRVPGNSGTLSALQEELNFRGLEAVDLENDPRFCELNVVSSLLKSFFRKLPDPLFTNELYEDFISMNRKKDSEERLNGLRRLIHMLPAPHYETLKFLVSHLKKVADNSDVNKMEIRNLAIVFGPTLVRSTISDNMATMVTDMSDQCRIVESVLQHSAWFFSDADMKESGLQLQPPPSEDPHEPVPNIDHLLANVGRTPGDTSDSTSESSKSKASVASEKESFSRDVMEMIFGAGKRWLQNQQGGVKLEEQDSSDDEYGFKEAQRNHVRAAQPKQTPPTPPKSPAHTSAPAKYQVAKPAASGIRAGWPAKGQSHLPHDIPARLYDFYVENLERLAKTDVARPFPNFSSSSTDTSPQVTPRSSQFGPPTPQRSHPMQPRRSSGAGLKNPEPRDVVTRHSTGTQPTVPSLYGESLQNKRYCKNPSDFTAVLATSTPLRPGDRQPQKVTSSAMTQNNTELSSINKDEEQNESDSDTSVYVGDTLEEKLKNLTNLDKKLERRPSRRYANRNYDVAARIPPLPLNYPTSKKLTAPSLKAGEVVTPDNIHMFPPTKKSSREMYQERKAQRQQHRDFVKANRVTRKESMLARCASDENIFNRCDPKRQVIRPNPGDDVTINQSRRRGSRDKVKRRHTLGASDFPGQDFWDKSVYNSLQNIAPESAMARLRPKLGSADPVVPKLPQARTVLAGNNPRFEKSRKTESYL
ncbi:uncharacterized protein LOC143461228 isoform X2 [Clavelina lepadiformis]|uniref:uncharacterized protein LOC143461228 isoform X2 n=1 Tax=Clavelina lepadiformis TaxID=159417 RepID=UPI004042037B